MEVQSAGGLQRAPLGLSVVLGLQRDSQPTERLSACRGHMRSASVSSTSSASVSVSIVTLSAPKITNYSTCVPEQILQCARMHSLGRNVLEEAFASADAIAAYATASLLRRTE